VKKFRPILVYITLLLIAAVSLINIIFTFNALNEANRNNNDLFYQLTGSSNNNSQRIKDSEKLINEIAIRVTEIQNANKLTQPPRDGQKGDTGEKGDRGESIVGEKGERGDKGDKGDDGITPEFQCNVSKNRWEIRYSEDLGWEVLNGTPVKCTITSTDIIKALILH